MPSYNTCASLHRCENNEIAVGVHGMYHTLSRSLSLSLSRSPILPKYRPNCETPVIGDETDPSFPLITCPTCQFEFCFHCNDAVRLHYTTVIRSNRS